MLMYMLIRMLAETVKTMPIERAFCAQACRALASYPAPRQQRLLSLHHIVLFADFDFTGLTLSGSSERPQHVTESAHAHQFLLPRLLPFPSIACYICTGLPIILVI